MTTLNSPSLNFSPGTGADSLPLRYSADQQRIMQILHATNMMTLSERSQLLAKAQNLSSIKFDLPLSISGRSLFHPSSERFDRPPSINESCEEMELTGECSFVDDDDVDVINSVLSEEKLNGAPRRSNALTHKFEMEKTNAKKSLLSGFGSERAVEDSLLEEPVLAHRGSFVIGSPISQETSSDSEEQEDRDDEGGRDNNDDQEEQNHSDEEDQESRKQTVAGRGSAARSMYVAENYANRNARPKVAMAIRNYTPTLVRTYLKLWLLANRSHPYPTKEQKKMLCKVTGLKQKQLAYWFRNARRRVLPLYQEESV